MSDETDRSGSPPPSLSDALEQIMANPGIISAVASALGGIKSAESNNVTESESDDVSSGESLSASAAPSPQMPDMSAIVSTLAPMMSKLGGNEKRSDSPEHRRTKDREALLCALKPYVSDGRREAIDHIIRISKLSDAFRR